MEARYVQDAPYVNVSAEPENGLLSVTWKNFAPSGTYRCTLDLAVQWITDHKLSYFLTDQRRRGVILHDDELWLIQSWCPRMGRTTLKRAAIVQSSDFFNRSTLERVVAAVQGTVPFPIRFFRSPEQAQHWLRTGEELPQVVEVQ